jgi:hypothetical protein
MFNDLVACLIHVLKLDLLFRSYDFGIKLVQVAYTDGLLIFFPHTNT